MPDLEPVFGDPFATRMQPVGGDPFASMTHQPDQPAQPYMHPNVPAAANAIAGFAAGGLQGAGVPLPDWVASNPVQRALQNPDNETAMGALAKVPVREGLLGKFKLEDLHRDFQAGLNNQQIANKYNVTKEAIQQRRTQMGYPQKPRGRPWPSRLEPVSHDPFSDEQPLEREVIQRGRSGRPIQTAPLPIGNESSILEAGGRLNDPYGLLAFRGRENEKDLLMQRQRQIRYDQKLAYPNKEDRPASGALTAIKQRLGELKQ